MFLAQVCVKLATFGSLLAKPLGGNPWHLRSPLVRSLSKWPLTQRVESWWSSFAEQKPRLEWFHRCAFACGFTWRLAFKRVSLVGRWLSRQILHAAPMSPFLRAVGFRARL